MTFSEALKKALKNYANFNGRARRSEYWYLVLFNALILLLLIIPYVNILAMLYQVAALIPTLACAIRRLHDTGRGGVYLLIALAPVVGPFVLIYWLCVDSQPGDNQFGPNPKKAGFYPMGGLFVQCVSGPLQGQLYPVGRELIFGRQSNCTVRMPDGTPGLSGRHCALRVNPGGGVMLEDLNSSYGTFLADGRRLTPNYPEPIATGASFYLASPQLMFRLVRQ